MHIEEESFAAGFAAAAPYLGYVHLSEANRGVPGRGMLDWPAAMQAIAAIGYAGPLTLESMNHVDVDIAGGLAVWRPVAEHPDDVIDVGLPVPAGAGARGRHRARPRLSAGAPLTPRPRGHNQRRARV